MYSAGSLMALLLRHRDAPIPSLSQDRADVPAELDEIYRRMAAKRPEDRFATMAEVVHALERVQAAVALSNARPAHGGPSPADASATNVTVAVDRKVPVESDDLRLTVALPKARAAPTASDVRRISDLTVVLVEPSRAQANIVRKFLQELGIENVLVVRSGREALELGKQQGTDVILSSMHLADMTGVQLAQALHDDPCYSRVGFVLASSDSDDGEAKKALDAQRTVLLPKPFDLRRLAQSLAQATGRAAE